jgi:hypothetical protein
MFMAFNIIQRRKICFRAKLYTRKSNISEVRSTLHSFDFAEVYRQLLLDINSESKHFFTDPELRKLIEVTSITNRIVRGS